MFVLVHLRGFFGGAIAFPFDFVFAIADFVEGGPAVDCAAAFGAVDVVGVVAGAGVDLAGGVEGAGAVVVFVDRGEVVEDVAAFVAGAGGAASQAIDASGDAVVHCPGHAVDGVDGLLNDVVAADPGEVPPVAHLEFHVGPAGLAGALGESAGVVCGVDGDDVADASTCDLVEGRFHARVVTPAEADHEGEIFFLCEASGFEAGADAGGVGGEGFFGEDMFSCGDCGGELDGAEGGVGCEDDDVDACVDDLLIGVEADELFFGGDLDARCGFCAEFFGDAGERGFEAIFEDVAHGDESGVGVGAEGLDGGAGASTAAADEADAEIAGGVVEQRGV